MNRGERIGRDIAAMKRKVALTKTIGGHVKYENAAKKTHPLDCGNKNCVMCRNPRKLLKEPTLQERSAMQKQLEE